LSPQCSCLSSLDRFFGYFKCSSGRITTEFMSLLCL
jgi:hypothetical protein